MPASIDIGLLIIAATALGIVVACASWMGRVRSVRRLALATLLLLIVLLAQGQVMITAAQRSEAQRLRGMFEGLAPTYAFAMTHAGHARVNAATSPSDPTYLRIIELQKELVKLDPMISDIYTLRRGDDGVFRFIVDAETDYNHDGRYDPADEAESRTPIGEAYDQCGPEFSAAWGGKVTFSESVVNDRWGSWITTAAPIYDSAGRIEAIVGVDYAARDWLHAMDKARSAVRWMILAIAATIVGAYLVLVILLRSMHQQSITQAQLAAAKGRADSASRAKSRFLANMSHEIRTPMTAILGFCEVLRDPAATPAAVADATETIRRNGEHLLSVINDILDVSKIEAGKMTLERIPVRLDEIVEEVLSLVRLRAAAKELSLRCDRGASLPAQFVGDPVRLRQVLINLLGNAIKFTEKGEVTLRIGATPTTTQGRSTLRFDVIDTGIGLTPDQLGTLFDPFHQADESTTRRFGGTGLGLTISRQIVNMMGGQIAVESQPGTGSTFTVTLEVETLTSGAVKQHIAAPLSPSLEAAPSQASALRVLVVDDAIDNRRLLDFLLKKAGVSATFAENGELALAAARAASARGEAFDLVLLDMQMPVMDGYTCAAALRADGFRGRVVALTASAMSHDRDKCLNAGCDDYLTKPIDRGALVAVVEGTTQLAA